MRASIASRLVAGLAALCGCTAHVGGDAPSEKPSGALGAAGSAGAASTPPMLAAGCQAPAPLRRLTNFEYHNSIVDLFPGIEVGTPAEHVPGDVVDRAFVFDNRASTQGVSAGHVDQYGQVAEHVARLATADATFTGCDPVSGTDACFDAFLAKFGERAFRRPLTGDESARIKATYTAVKAGLGFQAAEQAAIERILQSPQFLYRFELDSAPAAGSSARLGAYELASRLSYLIVGSTPDAALLQAAASGELASSEGVRAQAERLLSAPHAKDTFDHLVDQWLGLPAVAGANKDMQLYPRFSRDVALSMLEESRRFVQHVFLEGQGGFAQLFLADYTFVNQPLAAYYGLSPAPAGEAFERVTLPASHAAGLLGQGAFTSLNASDKTTSPVKRGAFVRTRLLCDALPPPPPNVPPAPAFTGKETARELLAKHSSTPECQGCHRLIDPIGLGFENLDAGGVWRDNDVDAAPVDASGQIVDAADLDGAFVGVAELGRKLGSSAKVRDCAARQYFRFSFGREPGEADHCALETLAAALAETGDFRSLVLRLVGSDAFQYRTN